MSPPDCKEHAFITKKKKKKKSYLSPNPQAIVQPEKAIDDSFHGFPLSLP